MNCPVCSKEITHHFVAMDLAWCDECRTAYSFSSIKTGAPEAVLQLADTSSCPRGFVFTLGDNAETVSTRSSSFLGVPLALLTLFWLFLTGFSFTIHVGIALLMALVLLVLFLVSATALFCRISLTFHPETGEIVYAKGPFRWLSAKRRFNGKDVSEVREGELLVAEGNLPRPVVILKNDKSYMLDFSKNDRKRQFLELILRIFITRA